MKFKLDQRTDVARYAVGDVHGCLPQLREALEWCAEDARSRGLEGCVHLLGDYVDRGPDSRGVLDFLIKGPSDDHMSWAPIKGNHDDMLSRVWFDPSDALAASWWEHGGQQTLQSYGWNPLGHPIPDHLYEWIPGEHVEFLKELPLVVETPELIFVHAGFRPGVPIDEQVTFDLMWIRGLFLKSNQDFGKPVVHGHSPEKDNPRDHGNRIALDSGCFASGRLSVAAFDPGSPKPRFEVFGEGERIRHHLAEGFDPIKC